MLVHRMTLVSFRLFRKKLGQLARFFCANGSPALPPATGEKMPVRQCGYNKQIPVQHDNQVFEKAQLHLSRLQNVTILTRIINSIVRGPEAGVGIILVGFKY